MNNMGSQMLENQVVIVTGATRGIGKAVLERFAAEGATVIGVYAKSEDIATTVQAEMDRLGYSVRLHKGLVDDIHFVRSLMLQVKNEFGRIDCLVNNAGIVQDQLSMRMTLDQWDAVIHTNYMGTLMCCAEAIPIMEENHRGTVINVVSITGIYGREAQINYGTSKGAIIGLTKLLARRYAKAGILVNAIAPGMIETEMTEQVPSDKMDNFLSHTHLERLGTKSEIANVTLMLASGLSNYVSGQVLRVDGGFLR
jgi:3-oxoacyl-[acyl-carrier protein] reductase